MAHLLLDTNAYSEFRRGQSGIVRLVRQAQNILFSPIVAGELFHGFRRGSRNDQNVRELHEFLASPYVTVVPMTLTTADRFGRIASALREKGTPIPSNDIWIAAQSMEHGAELVSFDRHFEEIAGLVWILPD